MDKKFMDKCDEVLRDATKTLNINLDLQGWALTVAILGICGTQAYIEWLEYKKHAKCIDLGIS